MKRTTKKRKKKKERKKERETRLDILEDDWMIRYAEGWLFGVIFYLGHHISEHDVS